MNMYLGGILIATQGFIFPSKRGDRLKSLVWDGTGLMLAYKTFANSSFA